MTLKLISLGRSHRVLFKPRITSRSSQFCWVSLTAFFAYFEVTWYVTCDWYWKSGPREILYWYLVSESLGSSHPWFISWDEIDRKMLAEFRFSWSSRPRPWHWIEVKLVQHVQIIAPYLPPKCRSNRRQKVWTDGRTDRWTDGHRDRLY